MQNPQLVYQRQSVKNASPIQLVIKMYDLVIQSTYREDDKRVRDLLTTLIQGLNFDHEPSDQLFSIYRYCQDLARKKEFEEIRNVLEPIRESWEQVANQPNSQLPSTSINTKS